MARIRSVVQFVWTGTSPGAIGRMRSMSLSGGPGQAPQTGGRISPLGPWVGGRGLPPHTPHVESLRFLYARVPLPPIHDVLERVECPLTADLAGFDYQS